MVYACGTDVSNYSAATDEFRVTPTYSLPAWLSLTTIGSGAGNLTTNGNLLDANDIPANPGIRIDVRRSGGAWVSSQPFGVTVTAAPVAGPIDVWGLDIMPVAQQMSVYYDVAIAGQDMSHVGMITLGKHHRYARRVADGKFYFFHMDMDGGVFQNGGVFSFDPDTRRWRVEDPTYGYAQDVIPWAADQGNYVYDSTRDSFWCAGGNSMSPNAEPIAPGFPGPATPAVHWDGLFKFSYYDGRWHWDRVATLQQIRTASGDQSLTWGWANNGHYDEVLDCFWLLDEPHGIRRINPTTFVVTNHGTTLSGCPGSLDGLPFLATEASAK